jgi:hypothetical protein
MTAFRIALNCSSEISVASALIENELLRNFGIVFIVKAAAIFLLKFLPFFRVNSGSPPCGRYLSYSSYLSRKLIDQRCRCGRKGTEKLGRKGLKAVWRFVVLSELFFKLPFSAKIKLLVLALRFARVLPDLVSAADNLNSGNASYFNLLRPTLPDAATQRAVLVFGALGGQKLRL